MSLAPISAPAWPRGWQIPAGSLACSFPRRSRYCTIIPVINEGSKLLGQLERMRAAKVMELTDIIIADGGSSDGSNDLTVLDRFGVRALIIKRDTGKLSAQLRQGYAYALQEGYEGVITIDGNGKDSVESISAFAAALDAGADYAQASRYIPGGKAVNTPLVRHVAIRLIHAPMVSLAAGKRFTDTTQGFRAYSRRYLLHPDVQPFRDIFQTYELLAYLSVRATRLGLKAVEIPTTRAYPASGPTPTKISAVRGNLELIGILLDVLRGAYNPPKAP
jgi:dolichol-phosphate mannosyltransferase